eukprot:gnl/TRDRNA2_/TRDRNA2_179535_c0_seq1.p1 gnl/TRDRNA2_/TRDRNA2_179535_c0~~gnl/TRDRNA2_/TRDRNA2_179535_c0_seq1.p1  ORF type:complete len:304 (-),score=26.98 gnl/TRDRNA2_/TRDRNA2_179535_c0_seq1:122-916(-)
MGFDAGLMNTRWLQPVPSVVIGVPITLATEIVLLVHLILCLTFISGASSSETHTWAGVSVSPALQCVNAAWFLLGIPCIVMAGVGSVYRVRQMITYYFYYLQLSIVLAVAWFVVFATESTRCTTLMKHDTGAEGYFVCGVTNAFVLFWMLVLVAIAIFGVYLVWSMRIYISQCMEAQLVQYSAPWQAAATACQDVLQKEAQEQKALLKNRESMPLRWGAFAHPAFANANYFHDAAFPPMPPDMEMFGPPMPPGRPIPPFIARPF